MKKLITFAMVVFVFVLSAFPCLAVANTIPMLPTGEHENWIVYTNPNGGTSAYNYTGELKPYQVTMLKADTDGYLYYIKTGENVWTYGGSTNAAVEKHTIRYDSTGVYASASKSIFGLPDIVESEHFGEVIKSLGKQMNVQTVVEVLVVLVGACVGLVFMWWGVRKLARALMSAWKKGRVSL